VAEANETMRSARYILKDELFSDVMFPPVVAGGPA
jgi:hypothetical protein